MDSILSHLQAASSHPYSDAGCPPHPCSPHQASSERLKAQRLSNGARGALHPSSRRGTGHRLQCQRAQGCGGSQCPTLSTKSCFLICPPLAQRPPCLAGPLGATPTLCPSRANLRAFRNQSPIFKHARCWVDKRLVYKVHVSTVAEMPLKYTPANLRKKSALPFPNPSATQLEEFLCPQQSGGLAGQCFSKTAFYT